MSVGEMCGLAGVSRTGYYRFLTTPAAGDKDIDLRDAIQRIALEFPSYGRPRMTEELHRRGWAVGPTGCIASCGKTTCCACGGGSSW